MKDFFLGKYLDAAAASSTRSRSILVLMIVASIVIFSASWNSRGGSWLRSRIDCIDAAEQVVDCVRKGTCVPKDFVQLRNGYNETRARECINHYKIDSSQEAKQMHEDLRHFLIENVLTIHAPFFGLTIDVNDLGILGGFTFVVLLLWYQFARWQEWRNLKRVFASVPDAHRRDAYLALSMCQVLTVPPELDAKSGDKASWQATLSSVVVLLILLPFCVEVVVLGQNLVTMKFGSILSNKNAWIVLIASFVFTSFTLSLSIRAIKIGFDIRRTWREEADKLGAPMQAQ
jgi:hypothetical protein